MKTRIVLLLSFIFSCQLLFAQAPDFTVTDIYGETHSLYEDYLDKGKAVILDFSTTWCSPCWYWVHQTKALENLYKAYGPEGSDELMVLFIEADQATTLENLYGETENSFGNWTEGTTYPFVETPGWEIADDYGIIGYPTVKIICPDGSVTPDLYGVNKDFSVAAITEKMYECIPNSGLENDGRIVYVEEDKTACNMFDAIVNVNNYGNNTINELEITIYRNNELYDTRSWTGSLLTNKVTEITLEDLSHDISNDETVFRFVLNDDENNTNNEFELITKQIEKSGLKLDFSIDLYHWDNDDNLILFYNDMGEEINQISTPKGEMVEVEVELEEGCYKIELAYQSSGTLIITDHETGNVILDKTNSPFVDNDKDYYLDVTEITSSINTENNINSFVISPNPTKDIASFSFGSVVEASSNIYVSDILGKHVETIFTGSLQKGYHEYTLDLQSQPPGVYIIHVETLNGSLKRKVIKN